MSNPYNLGTISYEAESTPGEVTTTTATLRIPLVETQVDMTGLQHGRLELQRVVPYLNACPGYTLGTMGGSFKTKTFLTGHGSTTAGATTATAYETWLGLIFGNGAVSASAGTTFTGGTATAPTTTASATFAAGSIGWSGALNDARGNNQPFVVSTHATTTLNLLTAMGGSPTNGDVCYSGYTFYLPETSYAVTTQRMLLQTANLQALCHGCHPTAVSISGFNPGEKPTIEVTWAIMWYEYRTGTFPLTTSATNVDNPAATAAGSVFVQDVGTATRAIRTARNVSISIDWGMATLMGPGGVNQYQDKVGARRLPSKWMVGWTEDADSAATTTPVVPGFGTSTTNKHILIGNGGPDGKRVAFYFPNVVAKEVARQGNTNGINSVTYSGHADVSSTTTNDLTLSAGRGAFG